MIWLVSGGRAFASPTFVFNNLDRVMEQRGKPALVVVGGARGVDTLAHQWANLNGIEVAVYKADWERHGRAAGIIRNAEMLEAQPDTDLGIFFPSGLTERSSPGTYDMLRKTKAAGIETIVFNAESHI